jgi:hypothetical protein
VTMEMLIACRSIWVMDDGSSINFRIRAPLRVLLYAQDNWKFNHLECAMCVAAAMSVEKYVHLPPKPPYFGVLGSKIFSGRALFLGCF